MRSSRLRLALLAAALDPESLADQERTNKRECTEAMALAAAATLRHKSPEQIRTWVMQLPVHPGFTLADDKHVAEELAEVTHVVTDTEPYERGFYAYVAYANNKLYLAVAHVLKFNEHLNDFAMNVSMSTHKPHYASIAWTDRRSAP